MCADSDSYNRYFFWHVDLGCLLDPQTQAEKLLRHLLWDLSQRQHLLLILLLKEEKGIFIISYPRPTLSSTAAGLCSSILSSRPLYLCQHLQEDCVWPISLIFAVRMDVIWANCTFSRR